MLITKSSLESITELVTGACVSLGTNSTEGNLTACIDFGKDESNPDFVKDFAKETKRSQFQLHSHRARHGGYKIKRPC